MGPFSNKNKNDAGVVNQEVDPMYNNEAGPNQQAQYGLPGGGGNVNTGAGSNLGPSDPMYNNSGGTTDPNYNSNRGGALKRGAEGAALGGVAGHHGHQGHTARDAALGGAGGAALQHEHNKHHNQRTGAGTGPVAGYDNTVGGTGTGTGAGMYNDGTGTGAGAYNDGTGTGVGAYDDGTGLESSSGGGRGVAGHHGHHGHAARDAALLGAGGAGGAALHHEHNKHHNQRSGAGTGPAAGDGYDTVGGAGAATGAGMYNNGTNTGAYDDGTGTGVGAYNDGTGLASSGGGRRMGVGSNQPGYGAGAGTMPDLNEAKKLDRSGKLDKVVGTLTGSTRLKEEGLQKRAEAATIRQQTEHLNIAQDLEAEAQMRRGHAVGLGAHPANVAPSGRTQGF